MRPVIRGDCPKDAAGNEVKFSKYTDAKNYMIGNLGPYCSYCEMRLDSSLAVEHVQPKSLYPNLSLTWNNFLLACPNCNSTKSNKPVSLADYIWPDRDNTFRALKYSEGGLVTSMPGVQQKCADLLIELVGLNKTPDNTRNASDKRWLNRREAWDSANRAKDRLAKADTHYMREQIVETACDRGFWSVWMTVFSDDADMLKRFITAMQGTCLYCFDLEHGCVAIPRPEGQC